MTKTNKITKTLSKIKLKLFQTINKNYNSIIIQLFLIDS